MKYLYIIFVLAHFQAISQSAAEVNCLKIAFVSYRTGSAEIFLMNPDGTDVEQITDSPENNRFPEQLDDRTLVFTRVDSARNFVKYQIDIYTKKEETFNPDPIVMDAEWEQISPDNRFVAFIKSEEWKNELFLFDMKTKKVKPITDNKSVGIPAHSINHRWSPNGGFIAFMNGLDWYNQQLKVYDVNEGEIRTITDRGYMNSGLLWLDDNQTIIANLKIRDSTVYELYSIDINNGNTNKITEGINLHPNISPDGSWIVLETQRHGDEGEVYIMKPDGSNQIRLTNNKVYDGRCIWFELK